MHRNTFVIRAASDREYSKEREYPTAKDAFDAPDRRGRQVWIKTRVEGGAFSGYFGPVQRP